MATRSILRLSAALCCGFALLGATGCDRSQPGPKPVTGDAAGNSSAVPVTPGAGTKAPNASDAAAR